MVTASAAFASLGDGPVGGKSYSEQMDAANAKFLAELRERLRRKGYEEVQIVPQMFVVLAKERGRNVTIIVDSDSLQTLAVGSDNGRSCPAPIEEGT
jgi:hypothetical protein